MYKILPRLTILQLAHRFFRDDITRIDRAKSVRPVCVGVSARTASGCIVCIRVITLESMLPSIIFALVRRQQHHPTAARSKIVDATLPRVLETSATCLGLGVDRLRHSCIPDRLLTATCDACPTMPLISLWRA